MTPKEKAQELVQRFINDAYFEDSEGLYTPIAKKAALIAVDEILSVLNSPPIKKDNEQHMLWKATVDYWQEVKKEIENL